MPRGTVKPPRKIPGYRSAEVVRSGQLFTLLTRYEWGRDWRGAWVQRLETHSGFGTPLGVHRFITAAATLPAATARLESCGHTPGGPRPAPPAHAAPSRRPARLANGGATNGTTSLNLAVNRRTGLGLLGRQCWNLQRDGSCAPSSLPLPLETPDRSIANRLSDVSGCCFPMGLCSGLLRGD